MKAFLYAPVATAARRVLPGTGCVYIAKSRLLVFVFLLSSLLGQAQNCPGSLQFDNVNPAVNLPASNQYYTGTNGGYTWECWFRLTQPFGANVRPLISALDAVLFEDMYLGFGWQGGWYNEPVTKLVFKVDGPNSAVPSGPNCAYAPPAGFALNTWYHACGVMNYNTQQAKLYVNGVLVDTKPVTTAPITRVIPAELSYNWSNTPLPLFGDMDEVRIWTRPLTATEVATQYTQCLTGNELNLLAYYRCNQPWGSTVTDATPNNTTGTFATSQGWSTQDAAVSGTACIVPSSSLTLVSNGGIICAGQSTTLAVSGATTYTWSTGANTSSIVVSPPVTTSYTVYGSVSTCSVITTSSVVITVTVTPSQPVVAVALTPVICSGETATLMASGSNTYSWSTGANSNVTTVNPTSTTTYSVWGGVCSGTLPTVVTVTVNPSPNIVAIPGSPTLCNGLSTTITASGANSYTWSTGAITNSIIVAPAGNTSYTVYGAIGSCTNMGIASIVVLPVPTPTAGGGNACLGSQAMLTAPGGVSYLWNGPNNYTSTNSIAFIPLVNSSSAGIYTVVLTYSNGCAATATVDLIAAPFALPTVLINATSKACVKDTIKLNGSGGVSYTWKGPNGFTSLNPNTSFIASSTAASGVYTLSVVNASNCIATNTVLVQVYPPPSGTLVSSHNNLCVPFCSDFSLATAAGSANIVRSSFFIKDLFASDTSFNYCFKTAGNHFVQVTFMDVNGCTNTSTLMLTAYPQPTAAFIYTPSKPVEGPEPVQFTNLSTGAGLSNFSWFFDTNDDTSTVKDPRRIYEKAGTYVVALVVSNSWGCVDTVIQAIIIEDDFTFYVPNSFTPNDNGLNDIFQPKGVGIKKYKLDIFDRWGEHIFSSSSFDKGWDGTYKGQPCPQDIYVWKIELSHGSSKTEYYTGHVSLVE